MLVTEEVVAYVVKYLRDSGYRAVSRSAGKCYVVSAQKGDSVYVMSISRGSMADVYVAKVVAPEYLPSSEWGCELLEYSPHGFYVLEKDLEKLALGIARKLELLDKLYRARWVENSTA